MLNFISLVGLDHKNRSGSQKSVGLGNSIVLHNECTGYPVTDITAKILHRQQVLLRKEAKSVMLLRGKLHRDINYNAGSNQLNQPKV